MATTSPTRADDYDGLTAEEQAVVRASWVERIADRLADLDLGAEFIAEGHTTVVELDEHGHVVARHLPAPPGR